ncbi:MAG: VCBS repeat-containing protein [Planctomycetota bacterium]
MPCPSNCLLLALTLAATSCFSSNAVWSYEPNVAGAKLGTLCSFAGDENGDGYDDFVVLAGGQAPAAGGSGQVYLFRGGPSGPASAPAGLLNKGYPLYGWPLEGIGDVNGDGLDDIMLTGYANPQLSMRMVEVHPGPLTGSNVLPHVYLGRVGDGGFGRTLAALGDLNQDGFADFAMGHRGDSGGGQGRAEVYYGAADFFAPQSNSGIAGWVAVGGGGFGASITTADVNGDGWQDLLVGDPLIGQPGDGQVEAYLNGPTGLQTAPVWSVSGGPSESLGLWIRGVGDRNGDGFEDFVANVSTGQGPAAEGLNLFFASPTGATRGPSRVFAASLYAVPAIAAAGDISGDGLTDIAFGEGPVGTESVRVIDGLPGNELWSRTAPVPGSQFGASLDAGGDVDGDGMTDLIIGAPGYTNGETQEGIIYLHRGL